MRSSVSFRFTGKETFFQGHFPSAPILPGVTQLQLAVEEARRAYGFAAPLKEVKKMKFVHVIEPEQDIVLTLERKGGDAVAYSFERGGTPCSSGVLVF